MIISYKVITETVCKGKSVKCLNCGEKTNGVFWKHWTKGAYKYENIGHFCRDCDMIFFNRRVKPDFGYLVQ